MLQILLTLITFTVTSITANKLDGIWIPVKQEIGGTILPSNAYEKQKLIISDSNYTFVAESVDKGVVKYQDEKMDIYGKEGVNTGKHFTARYKYEKDELTVFFILTDASYPENFETQGKHNLFLCVFKRETEAK